MGRDWEIGYHSMGLFFPLDFHFMVYFIIWKMHGFSDQFPITWEKTAKPIELEKSRKLVPSNIIQNHCITVCREPGKLVFILSPLYGCFFPLDFHPMVYFITWEMDGFSHRISHRKSKSQQNPSNGEGQGNWFSYFFHKIGVSFPIRFQSRSIPPHMGNRWVFSSISHSIEKGMKSQRMGKYWEIGYRENPTKPIVCGELGKSVLILFL